MFMQHTRTHARARTHTHVHTVGDQALSAQGLRLDEREARREEGGDLPHLDDTLVLLHRQPIRLAPSAAAPGAAGGRAGPGKAQGECWRGINTAVCVLYVCVCVCCMCIRVQCGALRGASAGAVSTTVRLRGPAGSLHACVYMPHASTHTLAACTCRYLRLRGRGGGRALALFAPAVQQAPRSPGRLRQCERRGRCGGR